MSGQDAGKLVSQLTVRLPVSLHRRLKVAQAYEGRSMNEVVVGMIEAWVSKREASRE